MKQIIMEGPKKSKIIEVDIPKINDNQLLVKVAYTGMFHSELYPRSIAQKGDIFGHKAVGIVADKGANVTGFKIGDRVTGLGGGGYKEFIVMRLSFFTCSYYQEAKQKTPFTSSNFQSELYMNVSL